MVAVRTTARTGQRRADAEAALCVMKGTREGHLNDSARDGRMPRPLPQKRSAVQHRRRQTLPHARSHTHTHKPPPQKRGAVQHRRRQTRDGWRRASDGGGVGWGWGWWGGGVQKAAFAVRTLGASGVGGHVVSESPRDHGRVVSESAPCLVTAVSACRRERARLRRRCCSCCWWRRQCMSCSALQCTMCSYIYISHPLYIYIYIYI